MAERPYRRCRKGVDLSRMSVMAVIIAALIVIGLMCPQVALSLKAF